MRPSCSVLSLRGRVVGFEAILGYAVPFSLVLSRVVGIVFFAPLLSMATLPMRVRALLAFILALTIYPIVPMGGEFSLELDLWTLLPVMFAELLVGAALGMLASVPMLAMEMAGQMVGHQMGLGLARSFNPAFESQMDVAGQMLFMMAAGVFLSVGGLEVLFMALVRTFETMPPGTLISAGATLETYLALATSGLDLALRVAAPVLGTLVLILIAMGFLMKTMPQINILSFGFAVKIVCGIAILTWSIFAIEEAFGEELQDALETIMQWAASGGGTRTPAVEGGVHGR